MENIKLSPNELAFIALANEYCQALENVLEAEQDEFVASMLKILPRIYISASDLNIVSADNDCYIDFFLDEVTYDTVKNNIAMLLGSEDVYLEVFEEDMKYSDTPIATSVSEDLADIYQDLYNFIVAIKDVSTETAQSIIANCKGNFDTFWGQKLCNVLRALHNIHYSREID